MELTKGSYFGSRVRTNALTAHALDHCHGVRFQPLEDRAGVMQVDPQLGVRFQQLEDRAICALHGATHAVLEIAARLMVVNDQCDVQDFLQWLSTLMARQRDDLE